MKQLLLDRSSNCGAYLEVMLDLSVGEIGADLLVNATIFFSFAKFHPVESWLSCNTTLDCNMFLGLVVRLCGTLEMLSQYCCVLDLRFCSILRIFF